VPRYSVKVFPGVRVYGGGRRQPKGNGYSSLLDEAVFVVFGLCVLAPLTCDAMHWSMDWAWLFILVMLVGTYAVLRIVKWSKKGAATKRKLAHEALVAQITQDRQIAEAKRAAALEQRRAEREAAIAKAKELGAAAAAVRAKREAASQAFIDRVATPAAQRRTRAERQPPAP
jgi:hypothetical protein